MEQFWFANTAGDLLGNEGFGLVATSGDPKQSQLLISKLGWALRWPDDEQSRTGAFIKVPYNNGQVFGWKLGGFRDHRGRPGARVAQLFETIEGETCAPNLLPRVAGTSLLPLDRAVVAQRSVRSVTEEDLFAAASPPPGGLSDDRALVRSIARALELLGSGDRSVLVNHQDTHRAWEAFWTVLPQGISDQLSATTAASDVVTGQPSFDVAFSSMSSELTEDTPLTGFVGAVLHSYELGRPAQYPEGFDDIATFTEWALSRPSRGRQVFPTTTAFLRGVLADQSGASDVPTSKIVEAIDHSETTAGDLVGLESFVAQRASGERTDILNAAERVAAKASDFTLAIALANAGATEALQKLASRDLGEARDVMTALGVSGENTLAVLTAAVRLAPTTALVLAVERENRLLPKVVDKALMELALRVDGDKHAANSLLAWAATARSTLPRQVDKAFSDAYPESPPGERLSALWRKRGSTPELLPSGGPALDRLAKSWRTRRVVRRHRGETGVGKARPQPLHQPPQVKVLTTNKSHGASEPASVGPLLRILGALLVVAVILVGAILFFARSDGGSSENDNERHIPTLPSPIEEEPPTSIEADRSGKSQDTTEQNQDQDQE